MVARPMYTGQAVRRREDARLLQGRGQFVADIKLPGMLHMAIVRSIHAHARIRSIDLSRALALPGVVAALTADEIRGKVSPLPCIDVFPDSKAVLHTVLADGKVRYVGEPMAVIAATSRYIAEDALDLVEVEYDPLPATVDPEQALSDDAPLLYEEHGTNLANTIVQSVGDVEKAFAEADRVFQQRFKIHRYHAVPMETRGVVAQWEATTGQITLWSSTQFPHLVRGFLSGVLSVPESRIRVIGPDVGGGFGTKCEFYSEEVLGPLMALKTGKPVQWIEDRREHFLATTHAREQIHDVEVAVKADGTITGLRDRSLTNNGAAFFTLATTPASIASAMLPGPYKIPNYFVEARSVVTNKTPLAVYRGAGHPQAVFCMERMMDIVATEMGLDKVQLRKQNMITPDMMPFSRGTEIVLAGKVVYDSGDYPRCLDMALELVDYPGFLKEQAQARKQGRYLGLGICCFVEESAIGPYETGTVRVDSAGKVTVLTGSMPHGQGHVTAYSQLVADEFGIDLEDVTVLYGDTAVITDGIGTFASRSGPIGGAVARLAAREVKEKALRLAAHHLECAVEDMEWKDGRAHVKGAAGRSISLAELARKATPWNAPLPDGMDFNLEAKVNYQVPGIAFANATHIAILEVDAETGKVEFKKYGVVHDCGTLINPMIVEGQVMGGVVQGVGGTLYEELVYDAQGQLLTASFMDYLLPTVFETPHMIQDHMESPSPLNPFGMKGAGEGGLTGAPGAISNAVADALSPLGVNICDGPLSPSRLRAMIREAQAK